MLADPDGLVWCACPPREGEAFGVVALGVDAQDPHAIATWWGERLGVAAKRADDGSFAWLEHLPGFPYGAMVFQAVPETKTLKNRAHWHVDLGDTGLDDLIAAGATLVRPQDDEIRWTVLADPEGNEFCCFEH